MKGHLHVYPVSFGASKRQTLNVNEPVSNVPYSPYKK